MSICSSEMQSIIQDDSLNPRNVGELEHPSAVAESGSPLCGAILRLTLNVGPESQRIQDAKFKALGCGFLVALASHLTAILKGLRIGEAARLGESDIAAKFGGAPENKPHCAAVCVEALHEAAVYYRKATLEEWNGDEALICTCFGVSEKSIEEAIHARGLRSIDEVTRECNAGGGCGSCHPLIQDILADYCGPSGNYITRF